MNVKNLDLGDSPADGLERIAAASAECPVLVFKKSHRCGISAQAEAELRSWLASREDGQLVLVEIDVVEERAMARGLTEEIDIRHASPQALLWRSGKLVWHASHFDLTADAFAEQVDT